MPVAPEHVRLDVPDPTQRISPEQVIDATVIATPRVRASASWVRRSTSSIGSLAAAPTTSHARSAAAAASAP